MLVSVILCNGKSSRMGQDKATLVLGNSKRMVDIIYDEVNKLTNQCYISGNISGYSSEILIPDVYDSIGPLGGIASALKKIPDSKILFLAVDMPAIKSRTLELLTVNSSHDAVLYTDAFLPICINSCQKVSDIIHENIRNEKYSIKALITRLNTKILQIENDIKDDFFNLNNRHELEIYEQSI